MSEEFIKKGNELVKEEIVEEDVLAKRDILDAKRDMELNQMREVQKQILIKLNEVLNNRSEPDMSSIYSEDSEVQFNKKKSNLKAVIDNENYQATNIKSESNSKTQFDSSLAYNHKHRTEQGEVAVIVGTEIKFGRTLEEGSLDITITCESDRSSVSSLGEEDECDGDVFVKGTSEDYLLDTSNPHNFHHIPMEAGFAMPIPSEPPPTHHIGINL